MGVLERVGGDPRVERFAVAGRKRFTASRKSLVLPVAYAANALLNFTASSVRICVASMSKRFASVRVAEALASESDDSLPHLAAEYPDHAARRATAESNAASAIEITRS